MKLKGVILDLFNTEILKKYCLKNNQTLYIRQELLMTVNIKKYDSEIMVKTERRKRTVEDRDVWHHVFDLPTEKIIQKIINRRVIDTLDYAISSGKESGVYRSTGKSGYYAVKIYRITDSSFRNLPYYIFAEERFLQVKKKWHQLVFAWALREYKNLTIMHESSVPVPRPVMVLKNILIEEFLGEDGVAYPILQKYNGIIDVKLWNDIINSVKTIYYKANMVHGDLSEYNIIIGKNNMHYIIDVSQAVKKEHPAAKELLLRDLKTIGKFFIKKGVKVNIEETVKIFEKDGVNP